MPGSRVLISPQGKAEVVEAENVSAALRSGYRPDTTAEQVERDTAARRGDDTSAAGAATLGALSGVSLGGSNVLFRAIGGDEGMRQVRDIKEAHPDYYTGGEVGGAIGAALLTGGGSAAVEGGAGGARLAGARLLGATPTGAISRVSGNIAAGGGIARGAVAGGIEGGAQAGGMYLSDAALYDKEISAEGYLASAGSGAAFGGVAGGGLVALEKGFVKARDMIPKFSASKESVIRAADDVDAEVTRALAAGDDSIRSAKDQLELMRLQRAELDVAAQARVLEKRAAEAAKAQASADLQAQKLATQQQLDEVRIAKAREPKTSRPGRGGKTRSPVEQTPDVIPPTVADDVAPPPAVADDIVGEPIGNARPPDVADLGAPADNFGSRYGNAPAGMEGDSLEDLLRKSVERGKPQTALDEIHEAMAELDPDAARLVDSVRSTEAAAANLQKRFRVRAPQEIGGSTSAVIPDAPNLTLGRVKQMYEVANDAEKAALLQQVGPEKAKALLEIVEGKAGFAKWYKNKNHWWDDPSYGPLPTKAGPSADDLGNLTPRVMPGAEGAIAGADDMARLADDELAALDDMHRAVSELSEYERSVTDLVTNLGPNAPPSAMEMAAKYSAAVDDNARKVADRMAQVADEAPMPSAFPEGSGPVRAPMQPPTSPAGSWGEMRSLVDKAPTPSPTPMSDALSAGMAKDANAAKAAGLVSLPGAGGLTAPVKKKGIGGMLADLGSANEALQFAGISLPFVPDVDKIPVIGPLVGGYLKLRAGLTVLGKAGFRVPMSGEARIAAGAAKTRDRVAQSVDRLLGVGAKGARAARPVVSSQAWRVPDALSAVLYDTGEKQPRAKSKDPTEMLALRTREVLAAQSNPAGVKATVRAAMRDVRDPDVINAVYAVAQRKFDYLAKHAPVAPPPNPLSKSKWQASPAEIERFSRRVRAANDPVSVLDDVAAGRVTPEGAETLREVYPQLYSEARVRLIEQAPKLSRSLPHGTIVRLSVLFDAPLVSSLEPDNLAAIQAAGKPSNDNGQGGAPMATPQPAMTPPPAGAPDLSSMYMTPGQKRAMR